MHGNLRILAVAAGIAIAISLVVIAGWILHIASLTVFAPVGAPMVVNTAVNMIATGCGLFAVIHRRPKLARFLASIIGLLGLLNLFQYVSGQSLGIDNLLWRQTTLVPHTLPGRMGPLAASNFVLLSLAIYLLAGKKPRLWLITATGGTLLFLALLPLLSEFIALSQRRCLGLVSRNGFAHRIGRALSPCFCSSRVDQILIYINNTVPAFSIPWNAFIKIAHNQQFLYYRASTNEEADKAIKENEVAIKCVSKEYEDNKDYDIFKHIEEMMADTEERRRHIFEVSNKFFGHRGWKHDKISKKELDSKCASGDYA